LLLVLAILAALGALVLPAAASRWTGARLDSAQGELERGFREASARAVGTGRACVVSVRHVGTAVELEIAPVAVAETAHPPDIDAKEPSATGGASPAIELARFEAPFDVETVASKNEDATPADRPGQSAPPTQIAPRSSASDQADSATPVALDPRARFSNHPQGRSTRPPGGGVPAGSGALAVPWPSLDEGAVMGG
jgi:type II secretory pathway pseudopilin PulG